VPGRRIIVRPETGRGVVSETSSPSPVEPPPLIAVVIVRRLSVVGIVGGSTAAPFHQQYDEDDSHEEQRHFPGYTITIAASPSTFPCERIREPAGSRGDIRIARIIITFTANIRRTWKERDFLRREDVVINVECVSMERSTVHPIITKTSIKV